MKYYFEIKTAEKNCSGTDSDFTIAFWGEKGQGDTVQLFSIIDKKEVENGETLRFTVDSSIDAGCVNKLELTKDRQSSMFNGWEIDYIKVSKQPIQDNQMVSFFQVNTAINNPGESKSFDVSSGYLHSVLSVKSRFEIENDGVLYVPPAAHYNKTVSTDLDIVINSNSIKTIDRSTGSNLNISLSTIKSAFDKYINHSILETLSISVNTTLQYTDTVDIEGEEKPYTYEILWQKEICTMSVELGEIIITFDVPVKKNFIGLKKVTDRNKNSVFESLGIALTRKCTAQCEMCCFACGPDKEEALDKDLVFRIIDEAAGIEEIRKIGFTGGEATLRDDVLIEGIMRTKQNGMNTSLTSNGFWGKDPDSAREWLKRLKTAGLDSLTISMDEYHQNYVPLESVKNIIHENKQIGISLSLAVGDSLGEQDALTLLRELNEEAYGIPVFLYPFMPVGRGENLDKLVLQKVDENWSCHNQKLFSILYDGSVYPCCSQAVYGSLLCEGNIKDTTLKEIMDRYKYLSLFSELTHHNFGWLLSKAEEYQIPVSTESHSACSFCHEVFSNKEFVDLLRKELACTLRLRQAPAPSPAVRQQE